MGKIQQYAYNLPSMTIRLTNWLLPVTKYEFFKYWYQKTNSYIFQQTLVLCVTVCAKLSCFILIKYDVLMYAWTELKWK